MGMVDFLTIRTAFFAKNGLDENGEDPKRWTWDKFETLSAGIAEAWH